jgi:16S rRNA (guanine527-N7)-methyltransferase
MPRNLLSTTATSWGIRLSDYQLDQFERYMAELIQWNSHTNLTTIVEPRAITIRHFLDSLALARIWADQTPSSLADIGTGAGFPGLPLKLLWPDMRLLLVESVGKKTEFLQHVVNVLGLEKVEISTARAEELGRQPRFREQFEAVTARAVATLNVLAEYCLPLCAVDGLWVAPKSADVDAEQAAATSAIQQLGGELQEVRAIHLPDVEDRTLVVVRKVQRTPERFPRRVGVPTKRPL